MEEQKFQYLRINHSEGTEWMETFRRCGCDATKSVSYNHQIKEVGCVVECGVCGSTWGAWSDKVEVVKFKHADGEFHDEPPKFSIPVADEFGGKRCSIIWHDSEEEEHLYNSLHDQLLRDIDLDLINGITLGEYKNGDESGREEEGREGDAQAGADPSPRE